MPDTLPPDRFDDIRRVWIATHQGDSLIQRRRAERLGRLIRSRQRTHTTAVPDPHDDTSIPPLVWRTARSRFSRIELFSVLLIAALLPLGWPLGRIAKAALCALIPGSLRGYPVAALLWSGIGLGTVTVLACALSEDVSGSFGQILVVPWSAMQVASIPVVAAVYGVLEGWLAVEGSAQWWPLHPTTRALTAADAAAILGAYDATAPSMVDARALREPGVRTRP
jgi:hypothetical protein